jgi:hypothetical protein
MMKIKSALPRVLCGLTLLFACETEPARELPRFDDVVPAALEDALLYVDASDPEEPSALVVDISRNEPRIARHPLPKGTIKTFPRPGSEGREVVVLTGGRAPAVIDGRGRDAVNSHLVLLDRAGERARVELPGRFQSLALSDDGRFVVAYGSTGGLVASNAAAVVDLADLDAPARSLELVRPVSSFVFSPAAASARRLLVGLSNDGMRLFDLEHLDRPSKWVLLKEPGDNRVLSPGRVIFDDARIFVQMHGSSEVLIVQLEPRDEPPDAFGVSLLQITAKNEIRDIALVEKDGRAQVVAVGDQALNLIDPITGRAVSTPASYGFGQVVPYRGRTPFDDEVRPRALLLGEGQKRVGFVDFDDGTAWAQQTVEVLDLPAPLGRAIPLLEHRLVVLIYASTGLGLLNLEEREVFPFATESRVEKELLDIRDGGALLWLKQENQRLGRINLLQLDTLEVLLNANARDLLIVPGAPQRIAVVHEAAAGHVTLLDPDEPSRERARELVSFLYTKLLD